MNGPSDAREAHHLDKLHDYRESLRHDAEDEAHERHGGDEYPDRDDCRICREAYDETSRYYDVAYHAAKGGLRSEEGDAESDPDVDFIRDDEDLA